jgi:hypothetical protein
MSVKLAICLNSLKQAAKKTRSPKLRKMFYAFEVGEISAFVLNNAVAHRPDKSAFFLTDMEHCEIRRLTKAIVLIERNMIFASSRKK